MSSIASQLLDHVKTRLVAVNGAGTYINDLSADDQVQIAMPPEGAIMLVPAAFIYDLTIDTQPGPQLPAWQHTATVSILAVTAAADVTAEARVKAAWDLADDIFRSLIADRSPSVSGATGSLVTDVRPQTDAVAGGAGTAYERYGVASITVTILYRGPKL